MPKTKRWILTVVGALVLTATLVAQGPRGRGHRGGGMGFEGGMLGGPGGGMAAEMFGEYIGLTEQQKEQAKAIRQASRTESQPIREQMKANHEQMKAAIEAGNTAEVDVLASQQGDLVGQLAAINAKTQIQMRQEVLTADQLEKLADLRSRMQERHEKRREFRRNRRSRGDANSEAEPGQ